LDRLPAAELSHERKYPIKAVDSPQRDLMGSHSLGLRLSNILAVYGNQNCAERCDKIYAFTTILSQQRVENHGFEVNYSTNLIELLLLFARFVLEAEYGRMNKKARKNVLPQILCHENINTFRPQ
jgi:hypothetical protein